MIELQRVEELRTANQLAYYRLLTDGVEAEPADQRILDSIEYLRVELDRKLGPPIGWQPGRRPSGRS